MEQTMPGIHTLNELYSLFSQGQMDRKQFEGQLFETILEDLRCYNLYKWNRDECMEFLAWFYPRLSRAVASYDKNGATFESYLSTLIRWSAREYHTRQVIHDAAEYAVWIARYPDMYTREEEPDYEKDDRELHKIYGAKTAKNPRQLLMLILKCYHYISDDLLEKLAPRVGMGKATLKHMIEKLRIQRIRHEEMARLMKERIHSQYYRCIVYEKRLTTINLNSMLYIKLNAQLIKARQRLDAMRKRLSQIRMEATNQQIANVIGAKKGTVDSNLHALKSKQGGETGQPYNP